jgi:hypothetical protein
VGTRFRWLIAKYKAGHDSLNWFEVDQQYGSAFDWKYPHRSGKERSVEQVPAFGDYFEPEASGGSVEITSLLSEWINGAISNGELGPDLANNAASATRLTMDALLNTEHISTTSLAPAEVIQNAGQRAVSFYAPAALGLDELEIAAAMHQAYLADEVGTDEVITKPETMDADPIGGPSALMLSDEGAAFGPRLVTEDGIDITDKLPFETVDFRGDPIVITGFTPPHNAGSTGRIQTDKGSFYPGVVDLEIIGHDFEEPDPIEGPSESWGTTEMPLGEERDTEEGEGLEHPTQVIQWADKVFGVTTRYRRFSRKRNRRVAGLYFGIHGYDLNTLKDLDDIDYAHPAVIRLLRGFENSFPIYTHELAHHTDMTARVDMEKLVKAGDPRVSEFAPDHKQFLGGMANQLLTTPAGQERWDEMEKELKQLDYKIVHSITKGKELDWEEFGRLSEGFAEYMRHWLTVGEEEALYLAPKFHVWFHATYKTFFPENYKNFKTLRAKVKVWGGAGWEQRLAASIRPPIKVKLPWHNLRNYIDDDLYVLRKVEQKLLATDDAPFIPVGDRPYTLARVLNHREGAMAWDAVTGGVRSLIGNGGQISEPLLRTLESLGALNTEQLRSFLLYAHAKHGVDVAAEGTVSGLGGGMQDLENAVAYHEADGDKTLPEGYGEKWAKVSREVAEWSKAHITMMAEIGLMDTETRDIIMNKFPHYLPLTRVLENLDEQGIQSGFLDVGNPVGKLRGSGHQILDPLTAMMDQSRRFHAAAIKHLVATKLIDMTERVKAHGWAVVEIDEPQSYAKIKVEDIESVLRGLGFDTKGLTDDQRKKTFSVITSMGEHHNTDTPQARVVRDGQIKWYEFDKDLWMSLQHIGKSAMENDSVTRALLMPLEIMARTKRIGATGMRLSFQLVTNPGKDIQEHIWKTEGHVSPSRIKIAARDRKLESEKGEDPRSGFAQWLVEEGLITQQERLEITNRALVQYDKYGEEVATHTTVDGIKNELVRRVIARQMMNPDWNPASWLEMGVSTLAYDAMYGLQLVGETMHGFVEKPHAGRMLRDEDGNLTGKVEFLVDDDGNPREVNRRDIMMDVFKRYGGVMSTYMGQDLESAYRTAEQLEKMAVQNPEGVLKRGIRYVAQPGQYLVGAMEKANKVLLAAQEVMGVMETGPRLDEMDKTLRRNGYTAEDLAYGRVPMHLQIEMMYNANTATIDFSRAGWWSRSINKYKAFFNVQVQSPVQAWEKFFNKDGSLNWKQVRRRFQRSFLQFSTPTIMNWFLNKDEEWWKELSPEDKLHWWFVKVPGMDEPVAIPRLYDIGFVFGAGIEATLDAWYTSDSKPMKDLALAIGKEYHLGSVGGFFTAPVPDLLTLGMELMTPRGWDIWRDRELMREAQLDYRPGQRFNEYTTSASKIVGEAIGQSPIKLDKVVRESTGGAGTDLLGIDTDGGGGRLMGTNKFWRTGGYGQSIDEFYKEHTEAKYNRNDYPKDPKTKQPVGMPSTEADQWWWLEKHREVMSSIGKILKTKSKAPEEEKKFYQSLKTGLSRRSLGKDPFMETFPSIFLMRDMPDDIKKIRDEEVRDRLYDLTEPPVGPDYWKRQYRSGKNREAVLESIKERDDRFKRAKRFMSPDLTVLGVQDAYDLLRAELKQQGIGAKSEAAGKRYDQLQQYLDSR